MTYSAAYVPPILTVDSVIFRVRAGTLEVLLIRRAIEPFIGAWALPGGYCPAGETTSQAMERILLHKAGIGSDSLHYTEQLYSFDTVARDPRGHAVSVTYMGLGVEIELLSSSTTQEPTFYAVNDLPELAYDHASIIDYAHERLRSKLGYTNIAFSLLPTTFTLTELQTAYEAIYNRQLDKRNFRKKYLTLNLIEETGELRQLGAHRPARLYRFIQATLTTIDRNFD